MALSPEESARVSASWADNIALAPGAKPEAIVGGVDPKTVFCKDWPAAKGVLQALAAFMPQPGPAIINLVIAGGDAAEKEFCR